MAWDIGWVILAAIFATFAFVIAFGAPFLPTLKKQVPLALDLIDLKPGQTLLELGSGDGRVLLAAAERGIKAIGYELNPLLILYARFKTRKYRNLIRLRWANFWRIKLPVTDGIFVFLLKPYMRKLDTKIIQECEKPLRLVSFAFEVPGKQPAKKTAGLYLYKYR